MTRSETALQALKAALEAALSLPVALDDVPARPVPPEGAAGLEPGPSVLVEERLSPHALEWSREVVLTLVVQDPDSASGRAALDALLVLAGSIAQDRTLGGTVDWVEIGAPESAESLAIEGAAALRAASVTLTLWFETSANPLEG